MADPTGELAPSKKKPKAHKEIAAPSDFETAEEFVTHVRKLYQDDVDADQHNREPAIEDAEFFAGKQWDDKIRARRELKRKPVLTVNRTVAYVGQIVGNRRMNETVIKVLPESGGKKEVAITRQGLIRNIEKTNKAGRAYDTALQNATIGGIGNFGVRLDYATNDVFDQDIKIDEYPDAFSIVWDRLRIDKTGRDANHVFKVETMPRTVFEDKYPGFQAEDMTDDVNISSSGAGGWFTADDVRVVEFWRMRYRKKWLALTADNRVITITEDEAEAAGENPNIAKHPADGSPYIRLAEIPYAEKYVMNGSAILAGPYELPISRLPFFRVPGWEITIAGKTHRFGLLRFLKDPQRLHNYWRSTIAEKLMMTPRARWVASDGAVAGRETQWRNAHLSDDPLLIWNGDSGQAPVYTQPAQLEVALIQESNMSVQDMRDVSNLHEAAMGQTSNEVSGKAIVARQRVSDVGTIVYHDNTNDAISEAGEVINELIPVAFDTARTIRTLDPNDKENFVRINDPTDPESQDISIGRYSTAIVTGPNVVTRRIEAQESMNAIFNAAPQAMASTLDLYVKTQDWPGSDEFAKRIRKTLPPNLIDANDLDPAEREQFEQQQQAAQAAQQQQEQVQQAMIQAELSLKNAQAAKAQSEAHEAAANARYADARAKAAEEGKELVHAQAQQAHASAFKNISDALLNANEVETRAEVDDISAELEADEVTDDMEDAAEAEAPQTS